MLPVQLFLNGIQIGALYALMAVGFAIIFGSTRVFHYAHGGTFTLASYVFLYAVQSLMWPWWAGALLSAVSAVIFGVAIERFIYRPIQRDRGSFFTLFVASFGAGVVVENLIALVFGTGMQSVTTALTESKPFAYGISISILGVIAVLVTAVLFYLLSRFYERTDTGALLRALSESPELVGSFGLSRKRASTVAFALGSLMVVPAAILLTCMTGVTPSSGHRVMLISLAATIIGGVGSLRGAGLGALILGVAESLSFWQLPTGWGDAVSFVILLGFILLRPSGLMGQKVRV